MQNLFNLIAKRTYPGRGLVAFHPQGQDCLFCAYWIMGRSENSRNRVFEVLDGNLKTIPADAFKVKDSHLIIYNARVDVPEKDVVVITNGDQTDTIVDFINESADEKVAFMRALMTRTFEDDAPNFTPRISMLVNKRTGEVSFSILKCANSETETPLRNYSFFEEISEGEGYVLTTYLDDSKPLESSNSEPIKITCDVNCLQTFQDQLWRALDNDNKISLYVEEIDLNSGKTQQLVVNKYERLDA